jgi:hypothetical protein
LIIRLTIIAENLKNIDKTKNLNATIGKKTNKDVVVGKSIYAEFQDIVDKLELSAGAGDMEKETNYF